MLLVFNNVSEKFPQIVERMESIIRFMQETEKLKTVYRSVPLSTLERNESSAEHRSDENLLINDPTLKQKILHFIH